MRNIQSLLKENFSPQKNINFAFGGFKLKENIAHIRLALNTRFECKYGEYPYVIADCSKPFSNEYSETDIIWSNAKYLLEGPLREKVFYVKPADGETEKLARALIRGEKYFIQVSIAYEGMKIQELYLSEQIFIDWRFFLRETVRGDECENIKNVLLSECPWLNNRWTPTLPHFKDFINFEKEHHHDIQNMLYH